jgi:hypothetical protein
MNKNYKCVYGRIGLQPACVLSIVYEEYRVHIIFIQRQ